MKASEAVPKILNECARLYRELTEIAREQDYAAYSPEQLVEMGIQACWRLTLAAEIVVGLGETRVPPADFEPDGFHAPFLVEALKSYGPAVVYFEGTRLVRRYRQSELRAFFEAYVHTFATPVANGLRAPQVLGKDVRQFPIPRFFLAALLAPERSKLENQAAQELRRKIFQRIRARYPGAPDPQDLAQTAFLDIWEELQKKYVGAPLWDVIVKAGEEVGRNFGYLYTVINRAAWDETQRPIEMNRQIEPHRLRSIALERDEESRDTVAEEELPDPETEPREGQLFPAELVAEGSILGDFCAPLRQKLEEKGDRFAADYFIAQRMAVVFDPDALTQEGKVKDVAIAKWMRCSPENLSNRKQRWEKRHKMTLKQWCEQARQVPDIQALLS